MCRANQKYWIWSWLLGLWACAAMANSELTLRPGDRVLLSLPGETSLNEIVEVRRDGSLLIPEIGDMKVAGLTLAEAEKNIGNELANLIHDISRFELLLKERLLMVNVLGYVNQPGQVLLEEGASVSGGDKRSWRPDARRPTRQNSAATWRNRQIFQLQTISGQWRAGIVATFGATGHRLCAGIAIDWQCTNRI